ncbi:SNARE-interacting protein KEULE-like isoform X3 [Durio zibethinus]|uniref:SNARE-interacting protein KEULE-like isoform X3 n=1 Tax=Durio zibethinus TaxID=66656 RepID=A0A6P5WVA2_DURZI|nr:SNARE-interacting protein KEULE-like isoform X3 [Durio zibethinus]
MSYSDSDSSSGAGDYKNFRQISRERLLYEMLRSAKMKDSKSTWKVLIMDKVTVKIMSYSCKMADITAEGVSLVEDIYRRRQPLPSMDAIYFIQPTKENVTMFLSDMSGRTPLYKKAFVYFSSPISRELVAHIKKDSTVLPRIGALSEMNLEYFAIDSQGFITDNGKALEDLFGDEENTHKGDVCLNVMATRIATVFASLREFPFVRYRAAKSLDPMTMTTFRDLIPTKLAAGIWNCLVKCKSIPNFPQKETCELLILDRSIDQIAPVIHEWTYDAMCHDLLNMEGNKYVHEIAGKINRLIRDQGLRELGQLEQDLVFGDAGMKDVIKFFTTNEEASRENKLRLLMILAAVYPEKFEGEKGLNLMKLAKLPPEDMNAVNNMRLLAPPSDTKKSSTGAFSLKFDMHKKKRAARKDRSGEQETWQLSRFYPIIEELVEKLSKGELSKDDYPCMNDPSPTFHSTSQAASIHEATVAHSMRSRRTPTWARPRGSDDGYSSDSVLRHASSDFKKMGKRIFVFIVGGGTRSELRVCHKLTGKLNREVVLGSTSLDDPPQFITKLKLLTAHEFSLDDLQI